MYLLLALLLKVFKSVLVAGGEMGREAGEWLQQAALEARAAHQSLTAPSQEGSQLPRQAMRQLLTQRRAHLLGSLLAIVDALVKKKKSKKILVSDTA